MTVTSSVPAGMPTIDLRAGRAERADAADLSIAILGLGYVGLPTALAYCETGHHVIGIDVSEDRLHRICSRDVDLVPTDQIRLAEALQTPSSS